jgi:hypothetical protein
MTSRALCILIRPHLVRENERREELALPVAHNLNRVGHHQRSLGPGTKQILPATLRKKHREPPFLLNELPGIL